MIFGITPHHSLTRPGLRGPARPSQRTRPNGRPGTRTRSSASSRPGRARRCVTRLRQTQPRSRGGAGPGGNGATFQNVGGGGAERPPPCPGASEGAPRRAARGALMGNRGPGPRYDRYRDPRESGRRHGDLHRREDRGAPRGAEGPGAGSHRSRRVLVGARFLPRLRPVPTCL